VDLHQNARSCPASRLVLVRSIVEQVWRVKNVAAAIGISERSAYRWLGGYRVEGDAGLVDRSSRPRRLPRQTAGERIERVVALRREGYGTPNGTSQLAFQT
jgi:transposase